MMQPILEREKQWLDKFHFLWAGQLYGQVKGPPMRKEEIIVYEYRQQGSPVWVEVYTE